MAKERRQWEIEYLKIQQRMKWKGADSVGWYRFFSAFQRVVVNGRLKNFARRANP